MVAAGALMFLEATEEKEVRHTTTTTTTTTTETLVHNVRNDVSSRDSDGQPLLENVHKAIPPDSAVVGGGAGSDVSATSEEITSMSTSAAGLSTVTTTVEQTTTSVTSGTSTASRIAIVGATATKAAAAELLSAVLPSPAPAPVPEAPPVPPPSEAFAAAAAASTTAASAASSRSVSESTTSSARIAVSTAPIAADLEASSSPVAEMERWGRGNSVVQQELAAISNNNNIFSRLIQMDQQFQEMVASTAGIWIERQRRLLQLRYHQKAYVHKQFQLQSSMVANQQDGDEYTTNDRSYASTELQMPHFDFETGYQLSSMSNFHSTASGNDEEPQVGNGTVSAGDLETPTPGFVHYLECMNLFLGYIISQVTFNNDLYALCSALLGHSVGTAMHDVEEVRNFKKMLLERGERYAIVQLSAFVPPAVVGMHEHVAYFASKNEEDETIISKFVDAMWAHIDATGDVAVLHTDAPALLREMENIALSVSVQ